MAEILTRYGHSELVNDPHCEWITGKLISELRTEQFDRPDDEHTQVSVSNEHWSVTAQVSGLITFDNMDLLEGEPSELPETMHLRNIPDSELVAIWQALIRANQEALMVPAWRALDELPPYERDFYRNKPSQNPPPAPC